MSDMDWQRADETQDLRPHLPDCIEHRAGLPFGCICDRLRAAEQRGRDAAAKHHEGECEGHEWTLVETQSHWYGKGREDAARDVEALRNRWNGQHDVVQLNAAVAAARGGQT